MAKFKSLNLQEPLNVGLMEQEVLEFWQQNQIFEKSIEERPETKPFVFYDGPPFATGLPHYGHILASTTKDVIPRYQTMMGKRVDRKWGWDCHGLPIENIIEKELNLPDKKSIEDFGIDKFNESCRSAVLRYATEWKKVITRLGRWVDMDNDYKTMDLDYMESLWWIFKALWDRHLIYRGHKSMHICPRCVTPLSNFEVTQGYKDIKDISVYAQFKLNSSKLFADITEPIFVLAWTTTPWTLPGNVLLAVNSKISYVLAKIPNKPGLNIVAKDRLEQIPETDNFEIIKEFLGQDLVGQTYEPLFPYFKNNENSFKIVSADYVTLEDGSGIVHIAPAFGENDYTLGKQYDIPLVQHVTMEGKFTKDVTDFAGLPVKPKDNPLSADIEILKYLSTYNRLFVKQNLVHSYPHCWRCDTPLINYATSSWFVDVTKFKDQLIQNNQTINWYPNHIKNGRFGKWLEGARDWAISRARFWGTPLPIWESDDGDLICLSSAQELETLSGQKVTDLHKHLIDNITITRDGKTYHRIPEVLDCWFESGAMPYAANHYPFENKQKFESNFPAEFISEGQDQTRGWFYTLHVLATALTLTDNPAIPVPPSSSFKNVVVSGIVLAEDGKKMSKSLQNYPDPMIIADKYGVDSLRLYLMTSPVVRAENLNFSEKGVDETKKKSVNLLWNIFTFYKLYDDGETSLKLSEPPVHILDLWLLNQLADVTKNYHAAMKEFDVVTAGRILTDFIHDFSTWWLRLSRDRIKDTANNQQVITVFRHVLSQFILLTAPFMPFISEYIYQHLNLASKLSIHLEEFSKVTDAPIQVDKELNLWMNTAQIVVEKIHSLRKSLSIKTKQPLAKATVKANIASNADINSIICYETNIKQIDWIFVADAKDIEVDLDANLTDSLIEEGQAREIIRQIQAARKQVGVNVSDFIDVILPTWPINFEAEIKDKVKAKTMVKGDSLKISRCLKV